VFYKLDKNDKTHFIINECTVNIDVFSSILAAHSSYCVLKITEE